MATERERGPDSRRSWIVAFTSALAMVFTYGTPYSYGIFLGPFADNYGISRVTLSTVFSGELFMFYAGAGTIGILATRLPSRAVVLASAGVVALLAPALFVVDSYAGLILVLGLLGAALGTVFVVLASVVPQWFQKRRGLATGVIIAGNGMGLFLLPPSWQLAFDHLGIRLGFLVLLAITAVTFTLAGTVCRRPPWTERSSATVRDLAGWTARLAGTRQFQLLFVGIGLTFAWYYAVAAYAVDLFSARGLTDTGAAVAFGLIGGVSIVSRLGGGIVADAAGYRRTFLAALGCATVGSVLLFAPQFPVMVVAILFFGIALGGTATLYVPILMQTYSAEMDTAVIGIFRVAAGIFALAIPPTVTVLIDSMGSFVGVILLTLMATLLAIAGVGIGTARA